MLVLTRKAQQQIQIGDNITITIVRVKGQSVRVGIEAPRNVRVVRGELQLGEELLVNDEEEMAGAPCHESAGRAGRQPAQTQKPLRHATSLKQRVALVTERVRDEAFQHERDADRAGFNPADHRMELCDHGQPGSHSGPEWMGTRATSPRATVPMIAFTRLSANSTK